MAENKNENSRTITAVPCGRRRTAPLVAGLTAWHGLVELGAARKGSRVLVHSRQAPLLSSHRAMISSPRPAHPWRTVLVTVGIATVVISLYGVTAVRTWKPPAFWLSRFEVHALNIGPIHAAALPALASNAAAWDPEAWRLVLGEFSIRGTLLLGLKNPSLAPLEVSSLDGSVAVQDVDTSAELIGDYLVPPMSTRRDVAVDILTGDLFSVRNVTKLQGMVDALMDNRPVALEVNLTLHTFSFGTVTTRLGAVCTVLMQVCPAEYCAEDLDLLDPWRLARMSASHFGMFDRCECLIEQAGCFNSLREGHMKPNVTSVNCSMLEVEVYRL
jgi:hypothetical protein